MRGMMRRARLAGLLVALTAVLWLAGCGRVERTPPAEVPDGNPVRGRVAIERYGCGSCHAIPGVRGAVGTVGPPLDGMGQRGYIAGRLPNNGPNLERWLRDPQAVEPGTAMPDLDVTEDDARDIAAYLFILDSR
jgi:cytochrome c1